MENNEFLPRFMVTFGGYYVVRAKDEEEARRTIPAPSDALPPCDAFITKVERLAY